MLLAFAGLVVIVLLVLLQLTRLGFLVRTTIPDRPRRRMFIASVSFLITFVGRADAGQARAFQRGTISVGDGARSAHSPPGLGHPHPAAGGLRMAAGPGPFAFAAVDFLQPADGGELRRGRRADAG